MARLPWGDWVAGQSMWVGRCGLVVVGWSFCDGRFVSVIVSRSLWVGCCSWSLCCEILGVGRCRLVVWVNRSNLVDVGQSLSVGLSRSVAVGRSLR